MNDIKYISLSDSYVLSIVIKPYILEIKMDFVLTEQHPRYAVPRPGEAECFRCGCIRVSGFDSITWRASGLKPSFDAANEPDFGNLDELTNEGPILRFLGDWGEISVHDGHLQVVIDD